MLWVAVLQCEATLVIIPCFIPVINPLSHYKNPSFWIISPSLVLGLGFRCSILHPSCHLDNSGNQLLIIFHALFRCLILFFPGKNPSFCARSIHPSIVLGLCLARGATTWILFPALLCLQPPGFAPSCFVGFAISVRQLVGGLLPSLLSVPFCLALGHFFKHCSAHACSFRRVILH